MVDERVAVWLRARTAHADAVIVIALITVCFLAGALVDAGADYFAFSVALLVPLTWRRRWPEWSAAVVAVVALVQWATVQATTGALPADIAVPLAVYTLAAYADRRASRAGLVVGLAGAALGGWSWPQLPMPVSAHVLVGVSLAGAVVAAWLGGAWQRARRGEFEALARQTALLEREQEQRTRLAVLSERNRIARDIHDILAHSLAVIVAQSDGGRYAALAEPRRAVEALAAIGDQGRTALAETRRAIGILREDDRDEPDPAPAPGISDLTRLADDLSDAGLPVDLTVDLAGQPLDTGVSLVVYRLVQEGLTNIVKHAGAGARAEVSVRVDDACLQVSVRDDGHSEGRSDRAGYGLVGMRERVAAYGGSMELSRRSDSAGHLLQARIPLAVHR
ncbi:sensor histidine kinase [Nocardia rhizosphaerihabitans]|uniref:histidine kinase n=1 Tax=Nocardia rhizosphaerihabitans TaxID=1691570 RepID=A0ABQ2L0P9_9NOCA|nr:histidine kinase [Nocardia rhizosphaerihabitans]GGN98887.1 two-component sensor histidine kinase [Nocardia rhizosphaerihabitans]